MTPKDDSTTSDSDDLDALLKDIKFLTARIQALKDRPFAFASLREAQKQLAEKRKQLMERLRDTDMDSDLE